VTSFDAVSGALDALVDPFDDEPQEWEDVLRRAEAGPASQGVRGGRRAALALAALVAAAAVAVAWPFAGEPPTVAERALAAIGDDPVVHVVLRAEWGGTLMNLETGERTPIHAERELWFDPGRGLREVVRFGGSVEYDVVRPLDKLAAHERETLLGFVRGYRPALESGRSRVVGKGTVDGIPVYWIRIHSELLPDVADGRLHEWAQEVAVSRDTFAPVYLRETRDGAPGPQTGSRVLRMDSLPAGATDLTPRDDPLAGVGMSFGTVGAIDLTRASRLLGRPALWPGPSVGGLELARVAELELRSGYRPETKQFTDEVRGVEFFYGRVTAEGVTELPDYRAAHVAIHEVPRLHPALRTGFRNYLPPSGHVFVRQGGRAALLRREGLVVVIEGSSPDLVLTAARGLRPVAG
jgi:hypothetical protein